VEATAGLHQQSTSITGHETRRERAHRLVTLIVATTIALAILLVLITVSQSGVHDIGGKSPNYTPRQLMWQLYGRVPQHGALLGSPHAPWRLIEYVDLQCPFCAEYSLFILPFVVGRHVRTGQVQLEMRPLGFLGKDSAVAARALSVAAQQNRLWQFADLFYRNQGQENSGYVTPELLSMIARQARVSPTAVVAAARSSIPSTLMVDAARSSQRYRVRGTPTFLLGRRGEPLRRLKVGKLDPDAFMANLKAALKR
jgi:protein-disulfide isomerase